MNMMKSIILKYLQEWSTIFLSFSPNHSQQSAALKTSKETSRYYWPTWNKCQWAYTIMNCPSCVGLVVGIICGQSSWSRVLIIETSYFADNVHMCPQFMHMNYLVNFTYFFKWLPLSYLIIGFPPYVHNHRTFIFHTDVHW